MESEEKLVRVRFTGKSRVWSTSFSGLGYSGVPVGFEDDVPESKAKTLCGYGCWEMVQVGGNPSRTPEQKPPEKLREKSTSKRMDGYSDKSMRPSSRGKRRGM